jgi:hypothetical protein
MNAAEGRGSLESSPLVMQAILEACSTAARLQLVLEVLVRQRNRLQALAALRAAQDG